jgi:hypothetical protein
MEKSNLENLSNGQLFFLLKFVINDYGMDKKYILRSDIMEDSGFHDSCDSAGRMMGFEIEYPIDPNFIASTIQLNPDFDFSGSRPESEIKKPVAQLYQFDIDEHRTEYVVRSYQHSLTSYSQKLVIPTTESMLNEGALDVYEGEEVNVDYYDGETNETKIDKDSIRVIR